MTRQHGHRRVITHRPHRLVARLCQRSEYLIPLFEADLKHLLIHIQLGAGDRGHRLSGVATLNQSGVLSQPLFVGLASFQQLIDILGVQYFAFLGVNHKNLTGADPTLGNHLLRLIAMGADFRSQGDKAIIRRDPARRAKPVAVQQAAGITPVCEHDPRRTVPGLHVHGVVLVEGFQVGVDTLDVLPGGRNQHAQCARQFDAAGGQELKHVIEA